MEASSTVVIKVKHGDMLRRFTAQIVDGELNLSIEGLKNKILTLLSFAPDTELMLTYIDEDSDVVALVDDDDLRDVVRQALNPLRITVKVNAEKNGRQYNGSSGSSTPLRSPRVQQPLQNLNTGVSEILRTVQEPLRIMLAKISTDLASKASSSAPGMTELVDSLSKMGSSYLGQLSYVQPRANSSTRGGVPGSSTAGTETKDSEHFGEVDCAMLLKGLLDVISNLAPKNYESLGKLKPEAAMQHNEVKINNTTGGSMEDPSLGSNAVPATLDSQDICVAQSGNDSLFNSAPAHPESGVVSHSVGKKEKVKKIVECYSNGKSHLTTNLTPVGNNVATSSHLPSVASTKATGEEINDPSESKDGSEPTKVGASDPMERDFAVDGTRSVSLDGLGKSPFSNGAPSPVGSSFPGSSAGPSPMHECPFSGIAVEHVSAAPRQPASEAVPFKRSFSQNDGSGIIFHRGVRCDGCGVHPITGPRFKSKVKVDYDLCSICFEEMGNCSDYIRMDRPAVYRHHMPFKGLHDARARDRGPTLPHVYRGFKVKPGAAKLDSRFIQDVNIIDGTVMPPLTPFTKIWRMRNNGMVEWPQRTQLVWIGGDKLSNALSVEVEIPAAGLLIDQELDVAADFISPELPGRYISYWRLASPSGQKFGQRVWVLIQVDASVKEMPRESVRNLNLNLPPVSSCFTDPEIINGDPPRPMVKNSHPEPGNSKKTVELMQPPIVDLQQPNSEHELKFPINDNLLVGNGASSSSHPSLSSPSVSYPIIDLSDMAPPPLPSVPSPILYPLPPPPTSPAPLSNGLHSAAEKKKTVEEELLIELEQMGFKQVDLNKEILRINAYDLERSVDDLCGVAEWDPILEELKEMGFHDTEVNKMLLKKNNGSIKRVVMDLIAGEKI